MADCPPCLRLHTPQVVATQRSCDHLANSFLKHFSYRPPAHIIKVIIALYCAGGFVEKNASLEARRTAFRVSWTSGPCDLLKEVTYPLWVSSFSSVK